MSDKKFGFIFIVNTVLGGGFFLVPGLVAGAGSGGYLIPLLAIPVLMYAVLIMLELSRISYTEKIKTVLKTVYSILCIILAAVAMALAALICIDIMLPGVSPILLLIAFSIVIYLATASNNAIRGLKLLFFICLIFLTVILLLTVNEIKLERLEPILISPISSFASILPFFAGLITVPFVARRGGTRPRITGALIFSCICYALICFICIGVLGSQCVASEKYALYIAVKSGELLLDVRMLLASAAFSLVLLKPSVNLAYTAMECTGGKSKWMRPVITLAMLVLSIALEGTVGSIF